MTKSMNFSAQVKSLAILCDCFYLSMNKVNLQFRFRKSCNIAMKVLINE